jgi:hypothetical protein
MRETGSTLAADKGSLSSTHPAAAAAAAPAAAL